MIFHLPYRQLEGFLRKLSELIPEIKPTDYTKVRRCGTQPKLSLPDTILTSKEPIVIAVDSTGIKVTNVANGCPRPLHPLISSKPSHSNHGSRTPARRLLLPETLSVLVAPEEMLARALDGNLRLQQFRILFIAAIRSGTLGRLDRSSMDLIVRRAFTSVQLRTILVENHHPFP